MNFIKTVFWLGLFSALVYTGFQFATPYYKYYAFKSEVTEILRIDSRTPEDVMALVMEKAKEVGVAVTESNVEVTGTFGNFQVKVDWVEEVNLKDQYKKQLKFSVKAP